jgi:hypothetical protein
VTECVVNFGDCSVGTEKKAFCVCVGMECSVNIC